MPSKSNTRSSEREGAGRFKIALSLLQRILEVARARNIIVVIVIMLSFSSQNTKMGNFQWLSGKTKGRIDGYILPPNTTYKKQQSNTDRHTHTRYVWQWLYRRFDLQFPRWVCLLLPTLSTRQLFLLCVQSNNPGKGNSKHTRINTQWRWN